ncbi:MAG: hypothetical protein ACRDKZ_16140, partial [Actinomycetota bacterium]
MRPRSITALALVLSLLALPGPSMAKGKSAKGAKATVVGKDAKGDWGGSDAPEAAPLGAELGQDLIKASLHA